MKEIKKYMSIYKIHTNYDLNNLFFDLTNYINNKVSSTKENHILDYYLSDNHCLYGEFYNIDTIVRTVYNPDSDNIEYKQLYEVLLSYFKIFIEEKLIIIKSDYKIDDSIEKFFNKVLETNIYFHKLCLNPDHILTFVNNSKYNYQINKITFNRVKFLGSIVKKISFNLLNNSDASKFINYLNKDISNIEINIEFNNDSLIKFTCLIDEGIMMTEYTKIDFNLIEDISKFSEELLAGGIKQCQNNNNISEIDGQKKA